MRSLRRSPAKHIDLLPQDQVFRFQRCSRLEARSQDTENQLEQIGHQDASLRRPPAASTSNRIFGTHSWVITGINSTAGSHNFFGIQIPARSVLTLDINTSNNGRLQYLDSYVNNGFNAPLGTDFQDRFTTSSVGAEHVIPH